MSYVTRILDKLAERLVRHDKKIRELDLDIETLIETTAELDSKLDTLATRLDERDAQE